MQKIEFTLSTEMFENTFFSLILPRKEKLAVEVKPLQVIEKKRFNFRKQDESGNITSCGYFVQVRGMLRRIIKLVESLCF